MPVHNGTFDLAMHAWWEPFVRIEALARAAGISLATPAMGERMSLVEPRAGRRWWLEVMPAARRLSRRANPFGEVEPMRAPQSSS
jgi:hypothetical protein